MYVCSLYLHDMWPNIRQMSAVPEQELLTLPEQLSLPPVFSGIRVDRSLLFCLVLVDRCFSFSLDHCVVCPSSIYGL